jgi:hypothetical protein
MANDVKQTSWEEELTIEFDAERNRNVAFGPEKIFCRGTIRRDRFLPYEAASEDISTLPSVIPGLRLTINGRTREARIWDPLGLPENAELLRTLSRQQNNWARVPEQWKQSVQPEKELVRRDMSETQIKTWLHEISKLVAAGMCQVLSGRLPKQDTIRNLPGMTQIELWNQGGGHQKRYLEQPAKLETAVA